MTNNKHADLAADVVLFANEHGHGHDVDASDLHVLLIQRGWDPYADCWRCRAGTSSTTRRSRTPPGGSWSRGPGITVPAWLEQVGIYDAPNRDPRGRVLGVAFVGRLHRRTAPTAGDDAKAARWVPVRSVLIGEQPAAFDHAEIIAAAVNHVRFNGWWCCP